MEPLKLLSRLVSIDSIYGNEKQIGEFLERQLKEAGFFTRRIALPDGRFNVAGERGSRGAPVLLFGHMDTVPAYGKREGNPFALCKEGDRLRGLGAYDMKAGIAAILCAIFEKTDRRIKVAFSADEENISSGSHAIVQSGFLAGCEAALTTEIPSTAETVAENAIALGRRGRCVIEISIPGRSAHGAQVQKGISAISEAARLSLELERFNASPKPISTFPPPSQFVRKISGESTSLSLPEIATLELDRHTIPPQTSQSALLEIREFVDSLYKQGKFKEIDGKRIEACLKERQNPYLEPFATPKDNPHVVRVAQIIERRGAKPAFVYGLSVADDNRLAAAGIPTFSIGPLGGGEHTSGEWVSEKSLLSLSEMLCEYVRGL